jgi:hypothetical protein
MSMDFQYFSSAFYCIARLQKVQFKFSCYLNILCPEIRQKKKEQENQILKTFCSIKNKSSAFLSSVGS